jgi:hypothetical protein
MAVVSATAVTTGILAGGLKLLKGTLLAKVIPD